MKVVCPKCDAVNNVSPEKSATRSPLCGKCKTVLEPQAPGYPVTVTDADFKSSVLDSKTPVLLDLWGPSCPPCRQLAPVLQKLAREYAGRIKVAKLNVEEQSATVGQFGIRGIPTLILFRNGKETARTVGFQSLEQLRQFVGT